MADDFYRVNMTIKFKIEEFRSLLVLGGRGLSICIVLKSRSRLSPVGPNNKMWFRSRTFFRYIWLPTWS